MEYSVMSGYPEQGPVAKISIYHIYYSVTLIKTILTFLVHQPHEQQPWNEAYRTPQDQHSDVYVGKSKSMFSRILYWTPSIPHYSLHKCQKRKYNENQPSSSVDPTVRSMCARLRHTWNEERLPFALRA